MEIYEELLQLNPESHFAHFGLGKVKFFQKNFQDAEEMFDRGMSAVFFSDHVQLGTSIFNIRVCNCQ